MARCSSLSFSIMRQYDHLVYVTQTQLRRSENEKKELSYCRTDRWRETVQPKNGGCFKNVYVIYQF